MKAYEFLDSLEKWCQGGFGKIQEKRCISWTIFSCYGSEHHSVCNVVAKRINPEFVSKQADSGARVCIKWNDAPERTWQEVHDLLKELDI